jgi:hypothetical protein
MGKHKIRKNNCPEEQLTLNPSSVLISTFVTFIWRLLLLPLDGTATIWRMEKPINKMATFGTTNNIIYVGYVNAALSLNDGDAVSMMIMHNGIYNQSADALEGRKAKFGLFFPAAYRF